MRIQVKEGVRFAEINAPLMAIMEGVNKLWLQMGLTPTITSVNDGKHMATSYHYKNAAMDIRTRDMPFPKQPKAASEMLAAILGPNFQVILEKDHIHVEVSPVGAEYYGIGT